MSPRNSFPMGNTLSRKHGYNGTRVYRVWGHMRERCTNPKNVGWSNYGGKGIRVCARWDSFENFLADMGEPPKGMTIDRKDSSGNYEPDNCRWATPKEQGNNRSTNRLLFAFGDVKTAAMWLLDSRCVVNEMQLRKRLFYGWGDVEALTRPAKERRKRGVA